jgi:hypothetical protein
MCKSNYMMNTKQIIVHFRGVLRESFDLWKRMMMWLGLLFYFLNAACFSCFPVGAYVWWRWSRPPMLSSTLFWRPKLCPSLRMSLWVRRWAILIRWIVVTSIHTEPGKVTNMKLTHFGCNHTIIQKFLSCGYVCKISLCLNKLILSFA